MVALDLIEKVVVPEYQEKAHVRAEYSGGWWHVHRDEELPPGYDLAVYIRCKEVGNG